MFHFRIKNKPITMYTRNNFLNNYLYNTKYKITFLRRGKVWSFSSQLKTGQLQFTPEIILILL